LHTYSSLNINFLDEYKNSMDLADTAIVFYSRHALELKRLPFFSTEDVARAFKRDDILVFNEKDQLYNALVSMAWKDANLLLMSSGNFDGINLKELSEVLLTEA